MALCRHIVASFYARLRRFPVNVTAPIHRLFFGQLPWRLLLALVLLPSLQGFEPARAARFSIGLFSASHPVAEHTLAALVLQQPSASRQQDNGLNHLPWQGLLPSAYFTFLLMHERSVAQFTAATFLSALVQINFSARAPPLSALA